MSAPHDPPEVGELLALVAEHVQASADTDGPAARYEARIASRLLEVARREVRHAADDLRRHREALAQVGCEDDGDLVRRIRLGHFDTRRGELEAVLLAAVRAKLAVASPGYADGD